MYFVLCFVIRLVNGNAEKIILSRNDFQVKEERFPGLVLFDHQIGVNFSTPFSISRAPSYYLENFNLSNPLKEGTSNTILNPKVAPIYVYVDDGWFDYWTQLEIRICWSASV